MANQTTQDEDRRATFAILDELRQAFTSMTTQSPLPVASVLATTVGRLWRCWRLFEAVVLLLRDNLPEEAAIVSRSLFEESLRLREMGEKVESRPGLALRLWANALAEKQELNLKLRRIDDEANERLDKQFRNEERQLQITQANCGVKKIPNFLSTDAAATRYRREDYWFYLVSHKYVHGSELSLIHQTRGKIEGGSDINFYARTSDLQFIILLATFSSLSLVQAAEGAFVVVGMDGAKQLAGIQDRLDPIIRRAAVGAAAWR